LAVYKSELKIIGFIKLNNRLAGSNSPTEQLKDDIVTEMGTATKTVGAIDKICLVDDTGTERDCTTALTYTDNAPEKVVIKASIAASASYTVSRVRSYSGSKVYFESSVSVTLGAGDVLDITLEITATVTASLSGSVTQSRYEADKFISALLRRLIGVDSPLLCLKRALLYFWSEAEQAYVSGPPIDLALDYDLDANKVTGSGSVLVTLGFDAEYLAYDNGTASPTELIYQYFSQLLPVYDNTSVVVSYEFTVT